MLKFPDIEMAEENLDIAFEAPRSLPIFDWFKLHKF